MLHLSWTKEPNITKQVECVHTTAKKYKVNNMLTKGKVYDVINETDEFIFIIDNSERVAGYLREYFKVVS